MPLSFHPAVRHAAKLRLAISGPSGAGKTYSALLLAKGLGSKIAVIDTELGSASLYANLVQFDTLELGPPYTPDRYVEALTAAEAAGYEVVVIDSISHEWSGVGGCLEMVDRYAAQTRNSYTAWGHVTPKHQAMFDAIQRSKAHVIATLRSKQDYILEESNGKKVPKKVGLAPVQRDGVEYEWTIAFDVGTSHHATTSKDRTGLFADEPPFLITPDTGKRIGEWLASGAAPAPQEPQGPAQTTGRPDIPAPPAKPPTTPQEPQTKAPDEAHWSWVFGACNTRDELTEARAGAKAWCQSKRDGEAWKRLDARSRECLKKLQSLDLLPGDTGNEAPIYKPAPTGQVSVEV